MIEILILYTLNTHSRTVYGIRNDILEKFGTVTQPSLGTIHPALKRLLAKKSVSFEKQFTSGGKKSTLYSITATGKSFFKELFFEEFPTNPTNLYSYISCRILTLSMLSSEDRKIFLQNLKNHLEIYTMEIQKAQSNSYVKYDEYQTLFMQNLTENINNLQRLSNEIK